MSTTPIGVVVNPADNGTLFDSVERNIDPRALSYAIGDKIRLIVHRRGLEDIVMNKTGGQTWSPRPTRQTGSSTAKLFECDFNGTWDAANLPSVVSVSDPNRAIQFYLDAWHPTNPLVPDFSEDYKTFPAPVSPGDATANTARVTVTANSLICVTYLSLNKNTWDAAPPNTHVTPGWLNPGISQYRVNDTNTSRHLSIATLYKIQAIAGPVGNVVDRELSPSNAAGMWIVDAYHEQAAGVTLNSVSTGATPVLNGQTGVVFTGVKLGATWTAFTISPTNNMADGAAVAQTIGSQTGTTMTLNALSLPTGFADFTNLYAFATDNLGNSNSSGFIIQRTSKLSLTRPVKNLAGTTQVSIAGLKYNVQAVGILGASVLNSTLNGDATTDVSGNLVLPTSYTLVNGGPVVRNDDIYLTLFKDNAVQALSVGSAVRLTPVYA